MKKKIFLFLIVFLSIVVFMQTAIAEGQCPEEESCISATWLMGYPVCPAGYEGSGSTCDLGAGAAGVCCKPSSQTSGVAGTASGTSCSYYSDCWTCIHNNCYWWTGFFNPSDYTGECRETWDSSPQYLNGPWMSNCPSSQTSEATGGEGTDYCSSFPNCDSCTGNGCKWCTDTPLWGNTANGKCIDYNDNCLNYNYQYYRTSSSDCTSTQTSGTTGGGETGAADQSRKYLCLRSISGQTYVYCDSERDCRTKFGSLRYSYNNYDECKSQCKNYATTFNAICDEESEYQTMNCDNECKKRYQPTYSQNFFTVTQAYGQCGSDPTSAANAIKWKLGNLQLQVGYLGSLGRGFGCYANEYCYCFGIQTSGDLFQLAVSGSQATSYPGTGYTYNSNWDDPAKIESDQVPRYKVNEHDCEAISDLTVDIKTSTPLVKAGTPITVTGIVKSYSETCLGYIYEYRRSANIGCHLDRGLFETKLECNSCPSGLPNQILCVGEDSVTNFGLIFTILGAIVGTMVADGPGAAAGASIGGGAGTFITGAECGNPAMMLGGLASAAFGVYNVAGAGAGSTGAGTLISGTASETGGTFPTYAVIGKYYYRDLISGMVVGAQGVMPLTGYTINPSPNPQGIPSQTDIERIFTQAAANTNYINSQNSGCFDYGSCQSICAKDTKSKCVASPGSSGYVIGYSDCTYKCPKAECGGYALKPLTLKIKDSDGNVVRSYTVITDSKGEYKYTFPAPGKAGTYTAEITATAGSVEKTDSVEFEVYEIQNVLITASPNSYSALPGKEATYKIQLINQNPIGIRYQLSYSVPDGWTYSAPNTSATGPGATSEITLKVKSPEDAADGNYIITIYARNETNNIYGSGFVKYTVSSHMTPSIDVAPQAQSGIPGEKKTYAIRVTNNDPAEFAQSTIDINVTSIPFGWSYKLSKTKVQLKGGASADLTIDITSNTTAKPGDNPITITATMYGASAESTIIYSANYCGDHVCDAGEENTCSQDCPTGGILCQGRCEQQTDTGLRFVAGIDPSINMLLPTFVVCKKGSNPTKCINDFSATNQNCGIDKDCICGGFPDTKCDVRCVDKSGAYYMVAEDSTGRIITSANYSYQCPIVDLASLINRKNMISNSIKSFTDMKSSLEYIINSNPAERANKQPCYAATDVIIKMLNSLVPYLEDVIAHPAVSNTTYARYLIDSTTYNITKMVNTNCYGAVGLLKIQSISTSGQIEKGNTINLDVTVENFGTTDYYSYVECGFTSPQNDRITKRTNCTFIGASTTNTFEIPILLSSAGNWRVTCSVYGSMDNTCSSILHDTKDYTFNSTTKEIFVSQVYGQCYAGQLDCHVTLSRPAGCVSCKVDGNECEQIGLENNTMLFSCSAGLGNHTIEGSVYNTSECIAIGPTKQNATIRCKGCGDGIKDPEEQCELPNTINNSYCTTTTFDCSGKKYGQRSSGRGTCTSTCTCSYEPLQYSCVKGLCGAECSVDADCDDHNSSTIDICTDGCTCMHTTTCPFTCSATCEDNLVPPNCYTATSHGATGCLSGICCEKTTIQCPTTQMTITTAAFTPTLYITNPVSYSTISNIILVEAQANNITEIKFAYDKYSSACNGATSWVSMSYNPITGNYEAAFDTRSITDDVYYICVKARYSDGQTKVTSVSNVRIKNYNFDLYPSSDITINLGSSYSFTAFLENKGARDTINLSLQSDLPARMSVNGAVANYAILEAAQIAVINVNVTGNSVGSYVITLRATGKGGTKTVQFNVNVAQNNQNNQGPLITSVTSSATTSNPVQTGGSVTVSASITGSTPISASVCTTPDCSTTLCTMTAINGSVYSCDFVANSQPGLYTYYVNAQDANGLSSSASGQYTVYAPTSTPTPTPQAQSIIIDEPKPNTYISGIKLIEATVLGNPLEVKFAYSQRSSACTGENFSIMNYNGISRRYEAPWSTTSVADGSYYVCVKALYNGTTAITSNPNIFVRNYDFDLKPGEYSASIRPGSSYLYEIRLENKGISDTYTISKQIAGWDSKIIIDGVQKSIVTLQPNEMKTIIINVTAPFDAVINDTKTLTVTVRGMITKTSTLTLKVAGETNNAPNIYLVNATPSTVAIGSTITLSAAVNDSENDNFVVYACKDQNCLDRYCMMTTTGSIRYTHSCNFIVNFTEGLYNFYVQATDSKGAKSLARGEFTVYKGSACSVTPLIQNCSYNDNKKITILAAWSGGDSIKVIAMNKTQVYSQSPFSFFVNGKEGVNTINTEVYSGNNLVCTKPILIDCVLPLTAECETGNDCTTGCECVGGRCRSCGPGQTCVNHACVDDVVPVEDSQSSAFLWIIIIIIAAVVIIIVFRKKIFEKFIKKREEEFEQMRFEMPNLQ